MRYKILFLVLILCLLFSGASALECESGSCYTLTQYDQDHVITPEIISGWMITQINVNDLKVPSNTSLVLDVWGDNPWVVWFNSTIKSGLLGGTYVAVEVAIDDPFGNSSHWSDWSYAPSTALFGEPRIDLTIQQSFIQARSVISLKYHIYPGIPSGNFEREIFDIILEQSHYADFVAFSGAQIESTDRFDLMIWVVTYDQFIRITETSIAGGLWNAATGVTTETFEWVWNVAIEGISQIPMVGPIFSLVLTWMALIVSEISWAIRFFIIENWLGTLLICEFFIIGEALISQRNKTNTQLMKKFVQNQVFFFTAIIGIFTWIATLIWNLLSTIGSVLSGIKPM